MIPLLTRFLCRSPRTEHLKFTVYTRAHCCCCHKALDLLKSMDTEEERERATVYMEGLAEMRKDWTKDPKPRTGGGKTGGKRASSSRGGRKKNS